MEDNIESLMDSKYDYEEWIEDGNNKAEEILNGLENNKKE